MTEDRRQMTEDRRQMTEDGRQMTEDGRQMTEDGRRMKQRIIKSFCGGTESVGQWVSGSVGQLDDWRAQLGTPLSMMPRPQPETNENQHQRFAQHIGSPRRGALAAGGENGIHCISD